MHFIAKVTHFIGKEERFARKAKKQFEEEHLKSKHTSRKSIVKG